MNRLTQCTALILFSVQAMAAAPVLIPRSPTPVFRSDVFFEGGKDSPASLQALRMFDHGKYERWVIDFADEKGSNKQQLAPKFQVRFLPAEKIETDAGERIIGKAAKLIVSFQKVKSNHLERTQLAKLVEKSSHIEKITIYPPIENGDTAMEFTFSSDSPVNIHQPIEKEGRLVIDIAETSKQ